MNGQKWVNSNAGSTVSDVIVSNAPFTVAVNRDNTALNGIQWQLYDRRRKRE